MGTRLTSKIFFVFFFVIFVSRLLPAQEINWAATSGTTGNDAFQHLVKGSDKAVYATGSENNQVIVAKYSEDGVKQWDFTIGGAGSDIARAIAVDSADNVYITGYFNGDMNFDPLGAASVITSSNTDIFIAKYDADGNYLWAQSFAGSGTDNGLDVSISPNGYCFVTGSFTGTADYTIGGSPFSITSTGGKDAVILKYDLDGNLTSVFKIPDTSSTEGRGVCVDTASNIYVSGNFLGTLNLSGSDALVNPESKDDFFLAKYDSNYNLLWYFRGSSTQTNQARRMLMDTTLQVLYVTGRYQTGSGSENLRILKNGGTIAEKALSNDGNYDTYIMQVSWNGTLNWVGKGGGTATQIGDDLSTNSAGDVYVSGIFSGTGISYFEDESANSYDLSLTSETGSYFAKYSSAGQLITANKLTTATINSEAYGLAMYDNGYGVIAGFYAGQASFPPLADEPVSSGNGNDLYIAKFRECTTVPLTVSISVDTSASCQYDTIRFNSNLVNEGSSPVYQWLLDGSPISGENKDSLLLHGLPAGSYDVSFKVISSEACGETKVSTPLSVSITAAPDVIIDPTGSLCSNNGPINLTASITGGTWSGLGITDAANGVFDPANASIGDNIVYYQVTIDGCTAIDQDTIKVLESPTIALIENNSPLCSGESLQLTASAVAGATYEWTGPNGFSSTEQNPVLPNASISNSGTYDLVVNKNGCKSDIYSTEVTVNGVPAVNVTASSLTICEGQSITFTANPTNNGDNSTFLWKVNGENRGTDSPVFTATNLTNLSKVSVTMTTYSVCTSNTSVQSNELEVHVNPSLTPAIEISASNTVISQGEEVTFSSTTQNGGTDPHYQWYIDDVTVEGATNSSFTSSSLADGQVVKVELVSSEPCLLTSSTFSNEVTISVNKVTGIKDPDISKSIKIYPVPLKDHTTVDIKNYAFQIATFKLYSTSGTLVKVITSRSNSILVEKGDLTPGIYSYVLILDDHYSIGKIVVE